MAAQREDEIMAFTDTQKKSLKAKLNHRHVKSRQSNGTTLNYVEGWHAIAEANRIFVTAHPIPFRLARADTSWRWHCGWN